MRDIQSAMRDFQRAMGERWMGRVKHTIQERNTKGVERRGGSDTLARVGYPSGNGRRVVGVSQLGIK